MRERRERKKSFFCEQRDCGGEKKKKKAVTLKHQKGNAPLQASPLARSLALFLLSLAVAFSLAVAQDGALIDERDSDDNDREGRASFFCFFFLSIANSRSTSLFLSLPLLSSLHSQQTDAGLDAPSLPVNYEPHDSLRLGLPAYKEDFAAPHPHPVAAVVAAAASSSGGDDARRMRALADVYGAGLAARHSIEKQILTR